MAKYTKEDFMEEEPDLNANNNPWKTHNLPFVPKEEVIEEEFDKMMEERYRDGARFTTFDEDSYEAKGSIDKNSTMPPSKDPIIWKVKCVVGSERHSAFCLMQKFVDMKSLGTKLQIISAFSVDHIKGFFYIEADKQCDINEGWEERVVKQEQSDDGSSEMKISLPSMPSLYVISFLCQACEEIHSIGGHVLNKSIVQRFALSLIEKVFRKDNRTMLFRKDLFKDTLRKSS